jgi:uncharacterized protein (DUF1800 family)
MPVPNTVSIQASAPGTTGNAPVVGSTQVTLLNPAPSISSLSPYNINSGVPYTITLTGTGFIPSSQVMFDGQPATGVKIVSSTTIQLTGTSSAAAGTKIAVTVTNPDPGTKTSGTLNLNVLGPISLTVSPSAPTIRLGATETFTAKVTNAASTTGLTNPTITWKVVSTSATAKGDFGSITSGGVYTPPATLPTPNTVLIQASATNTPSTTPVVGSTQVTLLNPAPYISSLAPYNINSGLPYTVTLTGTGFIPSSQVMFDGQPATGVKIVSSTSIQLTGTSTAAAGTKIAVTVTNPDPGTKTSGTLNLNVLGPISVTVSPSKPTVRIGATETFTAHVTDAADSADTAVTWQVNGKTGGDSVNGTIDAKGVYTAPAVVPATPTVTITAVSTADPTKSATATVSLENPVPAITSVAPATLYTGSQTLTVNGTGFAPGATIWFGGAAVTTKVVSDQQLTAALTVSLPAGGMAAVKVVNPNPGSATSNIASIPVAVQNPKMTYLDAVRFLEMATFGPTPADIEHIQTIGRDAWLTEQFNMPESAWPDPYPNEGLGRLQDAFFTIALTGQDQLRQRVSLALAEILVVSGNKDTRFSQMVGYQRLLGHDAFGSFRTLLGDMTLSPAMGIYLDMVNNDKANPAKGTAANENYARESMQLFTVGLVQLNPDGTPVPTTTPEYDAATVTDLAKVFTGWTYAPSPGFLSEWPNPENDLAPLAAVETHHDQTQKNLNLPSPCTIPAGGTAQGDLDAALDCIYKQQNVAPFVSYRLIQRLAKSAPSSQYVGRVAAVFSASKGNLQQVVNAILTDTEAMAEGTGKLREPMLQATTLLRELNVAVSNGDATGIAGQSTAMGQIPLEPGSVFSYFSPFFRVSGFNPPPVAPEFQSLNAETEFGRVNFAYRAATNGLSSNVHIDFSNWEDLASNPTQLVQAINQALYRGEMQPVESAAVMGAAALSTNPLTRVRDAVYVAAAAPQYQIEK